MKTTKICRYCGGVIRLVPAERIYDAAALKRLELRGEWLYQCQNCNARVSCHKGTTRPLGKVANEILRLRRIEAHRMFDAYWRACGMTRSSAYRWLATQLRMPEKCAHIGGFEIEDCQKVIELCRKKEYNTMNEGGSYRDAS